MSTLLLLTIPEVVLESLNMRKPYYLSVVPESVNMKKSYLIPDVVRESLNMRKSYPYLRYCLNT